MTQCEGQMDVFDVIADIEAMNLLVNGPEHTATSSVKRVREWVYVAAYRDGSGVFEETFYSQAECWAYIKGVEAARGAHDPA